MAINENGVQVERQYIGARYVPKFFQGVNGSPEWVAGLAYEPLTIVTYLGNSFTSKVPVPAGVGNPADNPVYWVNTGNYNAQVGSISNDVKELENTVETLTNQTNANTQNITELNKNPDNLPRYFLFIGDSYAEPVRYPNNSWAHFAANELNLKPNQYQIKGMNGYGFCNPGEAGTFLTILNGFTIPANTTVTDIVVCGGVNDGVNYTYEQVINRIKQFIDVAHSKWPNCRVWVGGVGWCVRNDQSPSLLTALKAYSDCWKYGGLWIKYSPYPIRQPNNLSSDGVHPSIAGQQMLGSLIATNIKGSNITYSFSYDNFNLLEIQWNDMTILKWHGVDVFTTLQNINSTTGTKFYSLKTCMFPDSTKGFATFRYRIGTNTTWREGHGMLEATGRVLNLYSLKLDDNDELGTIENISAIAPQVMTIIGRTL